MNSFVFPDSRRPKGAARLLPLIQNDIRVREMIAKLVVTCVGRLLLGIKAEPAALDHRLLNKEILRVITAVPARRHELDVSKIFVARRGIRFRRAIHTANPETPGVSRDNHQPVIVSIELEILRNQIAQARIALLDRAAIGEFAAVFARNRDGTVTQK